MTWPGFVAVSAVVVLFALAAPANASHVQCGDTITQNTTLDSDVVCPDDFRGTAVWIAADNITFNLAGYAIRQAENASLFNYGIQHQSPLRGVDIRNGRVEGFALGVGLRGIDHAVRRLHIKAREQGIDSDYEGMASNGTAGCEPRFPGSYCIIRNVVETSRGGVGIFADGTQGVGAHVWGNTVRGVAYAGIVVAGDRTRTVLNKVENCYPYPDTPQGVGIQVLSYMTGAVVAINTVTPCPGDSLGIDVVAFQPQPGMTCANGLQCSNGRGAQVRRNIVQASSAFNGEYGHGIFVADPEAVVAGNTANNNAAGGIVVASEGYEGQPVFGVTNSLVAQNTSNNNSQHGIYAPNVRDGGGNTATGNGNANCVGVTCP